MERQNKQIKGKKSQLRLWVRVYGCEDIITISCIIPLATVREPTFKTLDTKNREEINISILGLQIKNKIDRKIYNIRPSRGSFE